MTAMPYYLPVTTALVSTDEKGYLLTENWREVPMRGKHRIQRIWVARADRLAVFETAMGPWEPDAMPFQILSGIDDDPPLHWAYKVGELREIADNLRTNPNDPKERPAKTAAEFTKVLFENIEERAALRKHRTTSGRYITIARN